MNYNEIKLADRGGRPILKIETPIGDKRGFKTFEIAERRGGLYTVADKELEDFAIKILASLGYKIRPL